MPESRRRSVLLLALAPLALAALAAGCRQPHEEIFLSAFERNARKQRDAARGGDRVVTRDPVTGERAEDRSFVRTPGGTRLNHGVHRTWYPDGTPETLRTFAAGEPTGVWWTWWNNGGLRSAYVFDPERPTRMTWWHANGFLASEGLALDGSRTGPWRSWHENGELASEGDFVGGRRQGPWVFYDEHGEWTERGTFRQGRRLGDWEFRGDADRH